MYKEKLETFLNKNTNKSFNYTKDHVLDSIESEISLKYETKNFKRMITECLDNIELNKVVDLKQFLPDRKDKPKMMKKYEHLIKPKMKFDFRPKETEGNFEDKIIECMKQSSKFEFDTEFNEYKPKDSLFSIYCEEYQMDDIKHQTTDPILNDMDEIDELNRKLSQMSTEKFKEMNEDYQWHCLDYYEKDAFLKEKIDKFLNYEE